MDREAVERVISNLSAAVLKVLDGHGEITETELFTAIGRDFQVHFIPYNDGKMTDIIVREMDRRHGAKTGKCRHPFKRCGNPAECAAISCAPDTGATAP